MVRPGKWLNCMPATDILPAHHRCLTCEWGVSWNVVRLGPTKKYFIWQSVGDDYCHCNLLCLSLCLSDRICQAPDVLLLQLLMLPLELDHSTLTTDPGTMTTVEWLVPQQKKKQSKQKASALLWKNYLCRCWALCESSYVFVIPLFFSFLSIWQCFIWMILYSPPPFSSLLPLSSWGFSFLSISVRKGAFMTQLQQWNPP